MANTSYLRYSVEPWVRGQLAARYGRTFEARSLTLNSGGAHEFDAVSDDETVIASIKANSGLTSGANHPTGKVATCVNEIYYLTLVAAPARLLVLTNPEFFEIFQRVMAGKIASGIDVMLVPLPLEMQDIVDGVTRKASDEMRREGITAATAVAAEEAGELGLDV